jgi:hypothetical protein
MQNLERDVALVHLVAVIGEIQQAVLAESKGRQEDDEQQQPGRIPFQIPAVFHRIIQGPADPAKRTRCTPWSKSCRST